MRMLSDLDRLAAPDARTRVQRRRFPLISVLQAVIDPLLVAGSLVAITLAYGETFDAPDAALALLAVSLVYPLALGLGAEQRGLWRLVWTWAFIVSLFLVAGYLTGYMHHFRRDVLFTWALLAPVLIYVAHLAMPLVAARILSRQGCRTAVLVGLSPVGRKLGEQFDAHRSLGVRLVGLFDDRATERLGALPEWGLKGRLADIALLVKDDRGLPRVSASGD